MPIWKRQRASQTCEETVRPGMALPAVLRRSHAYLIVLILVGDLEGVHGSDHSLHGREDVLIHQLGEAPFVFIGVARPMDDSHLLDKCTLATLSCPCKRNESSSSDHETFPVFQITTLSIGAGLGCGILRACWEGQHRRAASPEAEMPPRVTLSKMRSGTPAQRQSSKKNKQLSPFWKPLSMEFP